MDIYNILIKYFGGKASKDELSQLDTWKKEAEENIEKIQEFKAIYDASNKMVDWDSFNKEEAWTKLNQGIIDKEDTSNETIGSSPIKIFILANPWLKIAAIGLILISINFLYNRSNNTTDILDIVTHYEATNSNLEVVLPDGSKVTLSPLSRIDIETDFINNRTLHLAGNAFFKVVRDESSPFVVQTDKGKVEVLGTEFNILNQKDIFELFVNHGKVAYDFDKRHIILTKDDLVVLKDGHIIKSKMYNKNYISWQSQKLIFRDAQWIDVFADLNRHYHSNINFEKIKKSDCKLNTTFTSESIEDVLEELKLLWNIKYKKTSSGLNILSIDC